MTDKLRLDYINSLPQPFLARKYGDKIWWPMHDIDVETGLLRLDVIGRLDLSHIGDIASFKDAEGAEHDPDTFYTDYEEAS
jgi:hypothetical protein